MRGKLRAKHYVRSAHAKLRRDLNALIDTTLTTCPGRLFQELTPRIEKNFSLRLVEHLFFFSLYLCPLVVFSFTSTGRAETVYSPYACIYIHRSCPLSFDYLKVRGERVSLIGWHNRNSSSQGPSSLQFFAHPLTILHPFHTLGMFNTVLQYSRCGLTSASKSHTSVILHEGIS